jgi:hypothetical protein
MRITLHDKFFQQREPENLIKKLSDLCNIASGILQETVEAFKALAEHTFRAVSVRLELHSFLFLLFLSPAIAEGEG